MKKILFSLLFCTLLLHTLPVFAENKVDTIDIKAVIEKDGSLSVTQVWEGDFDEGTEVYLPMLETEGVELSGLVVSDGTGDYRTLDAWDVDGTFEEKARSCGIHDTDDGYEICFGISRYGHNRYTLSYRLSNVIGSYTDMDGVNFRFVNDGMNTTPTDVRVEIRLADGTPLTDAQADIWGFGYEGTVEFEDGAVCAYTQSPLTSEHHVTVMLALQKGILSPTRQEEGSFADVKNEAFAGSDYDSTDEEGEPTLFETLLGAAIVLAIPAACIAFVRKHGKKGRQKKLRAFAAAHGYFRSVPNGGDLNVSYVLGRQFEVCERGNVLAVGILRLTELGCLSPLTVENTGSMGKVTESVSLQLMGGAHEKMDEYDEYLYTVLEGAAGADGILQAKELERFADKNESLLSGYIDKRTRVGKKQLQKKGCLTSWARPAKLSCLTANGEKELGELLGFQMYLEDFSLIAERGVKELPIWKELLTYALLFGIADRLAGQLKELYPDMAAELSAYTGSVAAAYACNRALYRGMQQAKQREQRERSVGSGGFASLGGGGGSIGGGSGGGTR